MYMNTQMASIDLSCRMSIGVMIVVFVDFQPINNLIYLIVCYNYRHPIDNYFFWMINTFNCFTLILAAKID